MTSSSLRHRLEFRSDTDVSAASGEWEYEFNAASAPTLRRNIRSLANRVDLSPHELEVSVYTYANGAEGRRDSVTYTGDVFGPGKRDAWSYNLRQELTGTAVEQPVGTPLPAQGRAYAYDPIGNRTQSTSGTAAALCYCANSVNQYTATDGDTPGCPSPTETFGHDADGNLEYDGTFTYEWDGENRLKAVYKTTPTSTSDKKFVFDYDYMSRRVRTRAFAWTGSAWATSAASDQRFVYDEWNVIMVLDGLSTNAITRKYTWGLDLSALFHLDGPAVEEIHGAGGIGGLLACEEPDAEDTHRYWFMYDANGNVGQVIDATSSLSLGIAARYEYDAYGNALVTSGAYSTTNPFRFSTKVHDAETGLYYYGYRYYSPTLGRWLGRDRFVFEETGESSLSALNLYSGLGNSPVAKVDPDGLYPLPHPEEEWEPRYRERCKLLANTIANLHFKIARAERNIHLNPQGQDKCCPGKPPGETVDGHRKLLAEYRKALREASDEYGRKCQRRYPAPDPAPAPAPAPAPSPEQPSQRDCLCPPENPDVPIIIPLPGRPGPKIFPPVPAPAPRPSGGGCGGGCFVAGTLIASSHGPIPIEKVKRGDEVWCIDTTRGSTLTRRVTATRVVKRADLVRVHVLNDLITCSQNHPFFTTRGWIPASELDSSADMVFILDEDTMCIRAVRFSVERFNSESPVPVYNFTVEGVHNYFVGRQKVLVHNFKTLGLPIETFR